MTIVRACLLAASTLMVALFVEPNLLLALFHSFLLTMPAALACSILALPITLTNRLYVNRWARAVTSASLAFLLIPIPAIYNLLAGIGFAPYSRVLALVTVTAATLPTVVIIQYLVFPVSAAGVVAGGSRSLLRLIRTTNPRAIPAALLLPTAISAFIVSCDPGLSLAAGTRIPTFGQVMLDSLSLYAPKPAKMQILLVVATASLWLIVAVRLLKSGPQPARSRKLETRPPLPLRLADGASASILLITYSAIAVLLAAQTARTIRSDLLVSALSGMATTAALSALTIALATAIGATAAFYRTAMIPRPSEDAAPTYLALFGVTAGGLAVAELTSRAGWPLTALVGGAGIAGGAGGIIAAQLSIAAPLMYLITRRTIQRNQPILTTAASAGASKLRIFVSIAAPQARVLWVGAFGVLLAFFITHPTPAIFVDSPAWPQTGHLIANHAAAGEVAQLLTLSSLGFICGIMLLSLGARAFTHFTQGGYDGRP